MTNQHCPQIKICGLTDPSEAVACARLGADAIGLVFYPKSPRNVSVEQAAAITAALPEHVAAVGVFVDPEPAELGRIIEQCGLSCAQLHGNESAQFVAAFKKTSTTPVIKALFAQRAPFLADASAYSVDGYLVECGKGRLPGGNAMTWDWSIAADFGLDHPLVLAGGLGPDNVAQAIAASLPDAVDASSSLEASPGRKDLHKVELFIDQVRRSAHLYQEHNRTIRSVLTFSNPSGGDNAGKHDH